ARRSAARLRRHERANRGRGRVPNRQWPALGATATLDRDAARHHRPPAPYIYPPLVHSKEHKHVPEPVGGEADEHRRELRGNTANVSSPHRKRKGRQSRRPSSAF